MYVTVDALHTNAHGKNVNRMRSGKMIWYCHSGCPFDNNWTCGDCLEVKREYYQNCVIL